MHSSELFYLGSLVVVLPVVTSNLVVPHLEGSGRDDHHLHCVGLPDNPFTFSPKPSGKEWFTQWF